MTSNKITEEDLKKFLPNSQAVKRQAKNDDLNFDDSNFSKKKKGVSYKKLLVIVSILVSALL